MAGEVEQNHTAAGQGQQTSDPATWSDRGLAQGFIRWFNRPGVHDDAYGRERDRLYLDAVFARRGKLSVEAWVVEHAR
jgi:hypothetical protein